MEHCVGHYVSQFLPVTEVWLYNLIRNHDTYTPFVLTRSVRNREYFPISRIFPLNDLSRIQLLNNLTVFKSTGFLPYFNNICKKFQCEILHTHFGYNGYKSIGLAKKRNIPLVCSFYGIDVYKYPQNKSNYKKYQRLFKAFTKGIVLGSYMKQYLVDMGCPEEKLEINHLGVEVNNIQFKPRIYKGNNPVRFLIASSLIEKKGIDIALKALKECEKDISFHLDIIGDGPLKPEIVALINNLKFEEKVYLHGYQSYDFFLKLAYDCDVFIQASKTAMDNDKEGTPMAIIDAMATGMPVIATRHSDIPEIVDDNKSGFLAEEDSVESLCNAIRTFKGRLNDMETIAGNARQKIEHEFNATKQVRKLESIYSDIINSITRKDK